MSEILKQQFKVALETVPHMKTENPEIELRFGKCIQNAFQSSLPKQTFTNVLSIFQSSNAWSYRNVSSSVDYFRGNLRITMEKDKTLICIKKIKLGTSDIKNPDHPFDLRLSISTESPCDIPSDIDTTKPLEQQNFDTIRLKERHTFHYKEIWKYDFTIVNNEVFEIEVELIDPKNTLKMYTTAYLVDSIYLKVNDILRLCSQ